MHFLLMSLLACPGSGGKDTADTGGSCSSPPEITAINADVAADDSTVTWTVDATNEMGDVSLTIEETGDPSFNCGPGKGGLDCGVWSETHEAFTQNGSGSSGGDCAEEKAISLNVVDDYHNQVDNTSTLFDSNQEMGQITVLFTVSDSNGNYADCAVSGENTSFFADKCTHVLN
jgi:hypothetical protein